MMSSASSKTRGCSLRSFCTRRRQFLRHIPGIEDGFNKVFAAIEALADRFQDANLGRERIGFGFELVPLARGAGIGKVAHNFHQIRPIFLVKGQSGLSVVLRVVQPKVMPESEWWSI